MAPSWVPQPRRIVFCVGCNHHALAKELQTSVFKHDGASLETWPIVFTEAPECVV